MFKNAGFLAGGRVVNALCSLAYVALAIRALGLDDFGKLVLINSIAMTGSMLTRLQSWRTLIHFGNQAYQSGDVAGWRDILSFCIRLDAMAALASLLFSLVGMRLYGALSHWNPADIAMAELYACVAPFMYTGWCAGVLRMTNRYHYVTINDTCAALLRTAGVAAGFLLQLRLPYFLAVWAASIVLDYALYVFFSLAIVKKLHGFSLRRAFRGWGWSRPGLWSFTRAVSLNQILNNVSGHLATLLVGSGLGAAEAAIFQICRQLAEAIIAPAQLLTPVLYPELVKLRDGRDWAGLKLVTRQIFLALLALSVVLLVIARLGGEAIFALMAHARIPHVSSYVCVMVLAAVFLLLITPLEPLLTVMGRIGFLTRNRAAVMLAYFPALYFATRFFGLGGACLSTALCNGAILLSCLIGMRLYLRGPQERLLNQPAGSIELTSR